MPEPGLVLERIATAAPRALTVCCALALGACSVQQLAINKVGDALSGPSLSVARDDDPELVRDAAAFSLKLTESLLEKSPQHAGLLHSALVNFTQYSYAFVQNEADRVEDESFERATVLRQRAKRLYLRARDYGLRALEVKHAGSSAALRAQSPDALTRATAGEVELLYWLAAAWAGAVGQAKDDPALIGDLPIVDALARRALELQPDFGNGALQSFMVTYEMAREARPAVARLHYTRAVELSAGRLAAPHIALAEAVSIGARRRAEFLGLLEQALAIDADAHPDFRLENLIMQRRARWLQAKVDDFFLEPANAP